MQITERETYQRLSQSLRLAAEHAENLAKLPAKGPTYLKLREELRRVEDMARVCAYFREDARWLQIGLVMERAHQNAGNWLRARQPVRLFLGLAKFLRTAHYSIEQLHSAKTGTTGMILPKVAPDQREHRPVALFNPPPRTTPGGIILPGAA